MVGGHTSARTVLRKTVSSRYIHSPRFSSRSRTSSASAGFRRASRFSSSCSKFVGAVKHADTPGVFDRYMEFSYDDSFFPHGFN